MAELDDLFVHRKDFRPNAPTSVTDECKCPECGARNAFSKWIAHNGMDSGYYCEDCNDFHSCFECPGCGEYFGAAGSWSNQIEVEAASHEHLATTSGIETTAPPDDTKPRENHVRDAVLNNLTD